MTSLYGSLRVHHNPQAASRETRYGEPALSVINRQRFAEAMADISSWPGYEPTPLHSLQGLARKTGVASLYYKDEGFRFGLDSFKALGGAYAVERLLLDFIRDKDPERKPNIEGLITGQYSDITSTVTVACATDGNHGRSVAWGAQTFGCNCKIYIHSGVSEGRKKAMEAYGAEVLRLDGDYDHTVREIAADAQAKGWYVVSDTSYEGYLDVPRDVMQGYTVMVDEALSQFPDDSLPSHIFVQGGVGGLAAAVCGHLWETLKADRPRFIVVEPDRADCLYQSALAGTPRPATGDLETVMAGLACGEVSLIAWDILATGADDFITLGDDVVGPVMRLLADGVDGDKPVVAGESAVAGLAALLAAGEDPALADALGINRASRVLVIGSEGASDADVYERIVGRSAQDVR
ncbi:MAG: diaminopropionate ammonia-lyase [Rhodospirillaceae bacterium]|nr:diaminopropionate ammonia-lyase [Rhodospirillaceae bacterium]MBL6942309.1 diaminopropionate ammonia-lyase [Rhodospirillales bacterium]